MAELVAPLEPADPLVRFVGVDKTFDGQTLVIEDLNLDIRRGEFLTLLGPSGSGKTTKLVLMDEPLGALDKQLRERMQMEVKHIHERIGVTVVYVTHDQSEALTMSDRIAVFRQGRIEQLATPAQLYEEPESSFVAQFIG